MVGTRPASNVHGLKTVPLNPGHADLLQRFFDANPEYFLAVCGAPARPSAGREEIDDLPGPEFSYGQRWILGYRNGAGELAAMVSILRDFLAKGVWYIGLFIVETARHGRGDAQAIHGALARWAQSNGARWLRLAVVEGQERAERFWVSRGYVQVRTREGVRLGAGERTLRIMVKPLGESTLEDYLSRVPRDRPDG